MVLVQLESLNNNVQNPEEGDMFLRGRMIGGRDFFPWIKIYFLNVVIIIKKG
jgi:hypothetical protein